MHVDKLFIYPIKSAGEIEVASSYISPAGFQNDRNFAVINGENKIITAREETKLLKLKPKIEKGFLRLGNDKFLLNFTPNTLKVNVQLFNNQLTALKLQETTSWISKYLGYPATLVKVIEAPIKQESSNFMDVAAVHLISLESLHHLNTKLETPVTIHNFRPNIVVKGLEAYAEEKWTQVKIGECWFKVEKKCVRCNLATLNKDTGKPHKQLLKTLASFKKEANNVTFGIYLTPLNEGLISKKDTIKIVS